MEINLCHFHLWLLNYISRCIKLPSNFYLHWHIVSRMLYTYRRETERQRDRGEGEGEVEEEGERMEIN